MLKQYTDVVTCNIIQNKIVLYYHKQLFLSHLLCCLPFQHFPQPVPWLTDCPSYTCCIKPTHAHTRVPHKSGGCVVIAMPQPTQTPRQALPLAVDWQECKLFTVLREQLDARKRNSFKKATFVTKNTCGIF